MAVFQMLAKMIGAEEFLGLIAFAKFMHLGEMATACFPIGLREIVEFDTAVAADVCFGEGVRRCKLAARVVGIVGEDGGRGMERSFVVVGQRCARP